MSSGPASGEALPYYNEERAARPSRSGEEPEPTNGDGAAFWPKHAISAWRSIIMLVVFILTSFRPILAAARIFPFTPGNRTRDSASAVPREALRSASAASARRPARPPTRHPVRQPVRPVSSHSVSIENNYGVVARNAHRSSIIGRQTNNHHHYHHHYASIEQAVPQSVSVMHVSLETDLVRHPASSQNMSLSAQTERRAVARGDAAVSQRRVQRRFEVPDVYQAFLLEPHARLVNARQRSRSSGRRRTPSMPPASRFRGRGLERSPLPFPPYNENEAVDSWPTSVEPPV